jgi:hypothetical protein
MAAMAFLAAVLMPQAAFALSTGCSRIQAGELNGTLATPSSDFVIDTFTAGEFISFTYTPDVGSAPFMNARRGPAGSYYFVPIVTGAVVSSSTPVHGHYTIQGDESRILVQAAAAGSGGTTVAWQVSCSGSAPTPPSINAVFSPTSINAGGTSTLTLTLTNTNASAALNDVAVAAASLPANLTGSNPQTTCSGGVATYASGQLSLSGASLPAGTSSSCSVTLDVTSSVARA